MELRLDMEHQLSPAASPIQLDPKFVHQHNKTAIDYQTFKDDVDALFCGQVPAGLLQAEFIGRILAKGGRLITAMEAEKQFLIKDVLCEWAVQQQKVSVATQYSQQMNYRLLDAIETQFEYFGELLEQTLTGLGYLVAEFPDTGFEQQQLQIRELAHLFLFYSVIVSRQPPAVVVKCNQAQNHRRSRFWFNTEIRVLGGRAFGLSTAEDNVQIKCRCRYAVDNVHIKCHVITDETAKQLRNNGWYEVAEHEAFAVEPAVAELKLLDEPRLMADGEIGPALMAKFDDMRVVKKGQMRRSNNPKRYHLCYHICLQTEKHQIELVGKKVSLPFAILVRPKSDVEALLFMERSFADCVRHPSGELPSLVNGQELVNALEMKFQSILEMPKNPADQMGLIKPWPFTAESRQHLLNRLKPNALDQVPVDNFLKIPAFGEFCVTARAESGAQTPMSTLSAAGAPEGEWELISPVPFYEWFFKLAEMVNKHFLQMWNDGLILGFCGKEEAEQLLTQCQRPTLLIRFSDNEFAKVEISVRDQFGVLQHYLYDQSELQGCSLGQELLQNARYKDIEFIWPQKSLECVIGAHGSPAALKPTIRKTI